MARMRRLQIMIEPELDDWLEREAAARGISKGALVRECVERQRRPLPPIEEDPLWDLVGFAGEDAEPVDDIDEVIYGLSSDS
jgi:hypothetical protein